MAHSAHRCTKVTLPARKWKWRMRGAAVWFTRCDTGWMKSGDDVDLILCSDMLSAADLRALLPARRRSVPIICYFHENQLTYPIPVEEDRDFQYGMTNVTSCLAADAVWFNSRFHLEDFLGAADRLLKMMPDFVPAEVVAELRRKAEVHTPPVLFDPVPRPPNRPDEPLVVLWCHRWEYDKNPEPFFDALLKLDEAGYPFRLVLLGEQFRTAPPIFADSWERLQRRVLHAGFVADRRAYAAILTKCDLVVSTAVQETFGIAAVEAMLAGCQPAFPRRLAYPELLPNQLHAACLFDRDEDLFEMLRRAIERGRLLSAGDVTDLQRSLSTRFGGPDSVRRIDDAMVKVHAAAQNA